jgi:photosystem II stability/assembly factor-like uncharacterized protein
VKERPLLRVATGVAAVIVAASLVSGAGASAHALREAPAIVVASGPLPQPGPPPTLAAVAFVTQTTGFGATSDGAVVETRDGGLNWSMCLRLAGARFTEMALVPGGDVVALGEEAGRPLLVEGSSSGRGWRVWHPRGGREVARLFPSLRFDFVSRTVVYAVTPPGAGTAALFRSGDGARTFERLSLPRGAVPSGGLSFLTPRQGFVTARLARGRYAVLGTTDGGRTWRIRYESAVPLLTVDFVNPLYGYAGGGYGPFSRATPRAVLVATSDGGATWSVVYRTLTSGQAFSQLYFVTADSGFATTGPCPEGGALPCTAPLLFTDASGVSWHAVSSGSAVTAPSVVGPDAFYVTNPWPFGPSAAILHVVQDGGLVRFLIRQPAALTVTSLQFVGQEGFLQTNAGVFMTADGGRTWARPHLVLATARTANLVFLGDGVFLNLSAPNPTRSTDGGLTWQVLRLPGPTDQALHLFPELAIAAGGSTYLLAVDRSGKTLLFASQDRGVTWHLVSAAVPADASPALSFSGRVGLVTGPRANELSLTEDGGRSWRRLSVFPEGLFLTAVAVAAPADLWAGGERAGVGAVLLHSQDGGQTWQEARFEGGTPLALTFADRDHGWLLTVGTHEPGNLFRTTDGGAEFQRYWPNIVPAPQKPGSSS